MTPGKKFSILMVFVFVLIRAVSPAHASKSVYVIADTGTYEYSIPLIQAYRIEGNSLVYQTSYNCKYPLAIGLAIDPESQIFFVTHEGYYGQGGNLIEIVNAKTMQYIDKVEAVGASNLAGIVFDNSKQKVYAIDRQYDSGYLYRYSWDSQKRMLAPDLPYPYYIQLQDCGRGFGFAIDEVHSRLYVADNSNKIKYYNTNNNTNNWPKQGEITASCNAISVAVDVPNQFLYYGSIGYPYGQGDTHLYKYKLTPPNGTSSVDVECSVAGIAVDQETSLVYLTTYVDGYDTFYQDPPQDRLIIYNSNLVKQSWESGDIGNPAGVAVAGDVSYKPPLFYLEKVDINEPNCVSFDDYITYRITYGPNSFNHNDVVITDYLPDEVDYVSSSPDGNYNNVLRTVTWQIGPLDANTPNGFVTLTVKVDKCAESDGIITNYCQIENDIGYSDAEHTAYLCSASNPNPACGAIVDLDTGKFNLTWCPGRFAADSNGHEVYFGSNFNDVHDANNSWPIGGVYKGEVNNPSYPIQFSDLDADTTYYWRIDEVNTAHPDVIWPAQLAHKPDHPHRQYKRRIFCGNQGCFMV